MSLEELKKIIEDAGWRIEEVSFKNGDTGLELSQYSPVGEDFSFVINDADDVDSIIADIYEYEDNYDPNEHMALWVDSAGRNGTPDLMTLAENAKAIGKMIEDLADAIRNKTQKSIGEIVDDNKVEESKKEDTKVYNFSIELKTNEPDSIEFKKLTHHMDYLINFDMADYPIVVSNVKVSNDNSIVKITGVLNITFNDKVLSTSEIEDMLSNLIILDGWDNLDFKVIDVSVNNLKKESKDEKTKVYNFSIELKTNEPDSIEFKKLTHHMDYLINFDMAEYPIVVSNVEVSNDNSTVKITGILDIVFNDKVLSTSEIEDMLSNLIILDGWDNLEFKVIDVSVSDLKEESKLQEADEDTDIDEDTENTDALDNLIKEWEEKSPLYERVISEIVEDSEDYDGTKLERIQKRLKDISYGLASGIVSSLIYYTDTTSFYNEFEDDIYDVIEELDDGARLLDVLKQQHSEIEIIMHTDTVVNDVVWWIYELIAANFSDALSEL